MKPMIAVATAILLGGTAQAIVPQFEDLAQLQARIAAYLGQSADTGAQVQPLDQRLQWQRPCVRLGQMGCSHHLAMADSQLQSGPKPML